MSRQNISERGFWGRGFFSREKIAMAGIVVLVVFGLATCVTHFVRSESARRAQLAIAPKSRQQAQDTVYGYYQRTLRELPEGIALDNSRYGSVSSTVIRCDDNATDPNAPASYSDSRVVAAPPGAVTHPPETYYDAFVAKVGEIWRGWGWRVEQQDSPNKPDRLGYAPDGYWLSIESAPPGFSGYPPTMHGGSPCFPGDDSRYEPIPEARVITRDGPHYDQPSSSPQPTR